MLIVGPTFFRKIIYDAANWTSDIITHVLSTITSPHMTEISFPLYLTLQHIEQEDYPSIQWTELDKAVSNAIRIGGSKRLNLVLLAQPDFRKEEDVQNEDEKSLLISCMSSYLPISDSRGVVRILIPHRIQDFFR